MCPRVKPPTKTSSEVYGSDETFFDDDMADDSFRSIREIASVVGRSDRNSRLVELLTQTLLLMIDPRDELRDIQSIDGIISRN
jgi:hypothetical protein